MKTLYKNILSIFGILGALALSVGFSFAQTLPTYNQNRTITSTGATMNMSNGCNPYKAGAFYVGSDVYFFLLSETLRPDSYGIFSQSYAWTYGNVFSTGLQLPFISSVQPKDGTPGLGGETKMLITEARNSHFVVPSGYSTPRNQIAGEIITKNHYRLLRTTTPNINYFFTNRNAPTTQVTMSASQNFSNNVTWKTACYAYYLAYCGDNVIDKATGTSDGNGGIQTANEGFIAWNAENNIVPNEVCDEGALNGTPGHCKADCTGLGSGPTLGASCTLTPSASTIQAGQTVTINAAYTSGQNPTFTPNLAEFTGFTSPTRNGSATDAPTSTTTYTMNVEGANGLSGTSCSTTVTVTPPTPHLSCTLTIAPTISTTGQIVSVGWNVTNGNFFGTYIYISPALGGARPHRVNANEYNGVSSVMPTQIGDYVFTMYVNNDLESTTCTGTLHVAENIPSSCVLTGPTAAIMPGQIAILNASYTNTTLATMTPNIIGLNFVYPNRSNNNISVHPTITTTYTLNTLNAFGLSTSCSATVNVINTGLVIGKTVVNDIPYHSGELVSFKINFMNNGPSTINNVILSDYLPLGLDYVSSQIVGVAPYTFGTGFGGGFQYVTYSGFSLTPGQQGYLIVVGRFRGYEYSHYTINNAFIQGDNSTIAYAAAMFHVYTPTGNASAIKTSNKSSYFPGEDARFTIAVTNNGPDPISNVAITDNWPNTSCITPDITGAVASVPTTITSTTNPYTWTYNGSLAVGQTIYLYITGHISNSPSCIGSYVNNSRITYTINGNTQTGNAAGLNFTISASPNSTMNFEKRLVQYGSNVGDPVVFELLYQNNGSATITNYDITDYRPGTLNFVSASPMPTTQTPNSGGMLLHWIFNTPLAPNGSGKITINGTVN